ncbi:MAG: aminotransferase class I/II-fold pyridoxal phosphate-dependent enzyme [Archaeoglobaceae archaeon]
MREASRLSEVSASMIRKMFEVVEKAKKEGKDIVSLTIGEPDFSTPEEVIERAYRALKNGFTHYTSNFGLEELRLQIANRYNVDAKNIMLTAGTSEALLNASLAFIENGSRVVIASPSFLSYFTYAKMCGAKITQIKTHENDFLINPDDLNEVMSRDVSLIFINYPNNPTGAVMNQKEMNAIAEIAKDYGALVLSDEVYDSIHYEKKPGTLVGYENAIVVNGFSKSLAMTGWRIGYVVAEPELLEPMLKVHQVNGVCAPAFAQKAVAEVMAEGLFDKIVQRMVKEFWKRRDYVYGELKKIFDFNKPEGAFYMFMDVGEDCISYAEKIIEYGVAVTPGRAFGDWNDRFIRISYANSMENLKKAVDRILSYHEDREAKSRASK